MSRHDFRAASSAERARIVKDNSRAKADDKAREIRNHFSPLGCRSAGIDCWADARMSSVTLIAVTIFFETASVQ
jgi:hypothetical protein